MKARVAFLLSAGLHTLHGCLNPVSNRSVSRRRKKAPRRLGGQRGPAGKVTTRWVEPTPRVKHPDEPATDKQRRYVYVLARKAGVEAPEIETKQDASIAIGRLLQLGKRQGEKWEPRKPDPHRDIVSRARQFSNPGKLFEPGTEGAWQRNRHWMTAEEFEVVKDAMGRRAKE